MMTRSFSATVANRAAHDPEFRAALEEEIVQAFVSGDKDTAKALEDHQNYREARSDKEWVDKGA